MEREELLSGSPEGSSRRGSGSSVGRIGPVPKLERHKQLQSYESFWSAADVETAISLDLIEKAERWKLLAREPLAGSARAHEHDDLIDRQGEFTLPEETPLLSNEIDKHEVASYYVQDALAGRESAICIHDRRSLGALKVVRNKAWNQVLNVCTIVHLALPILEIQRCLPCMGPQHVLNDSDDLGQGWRPTTLGSMWIECLLCVLYTYDLYQVSLSRSNHVHDRIDNSEGGKREKPHRQHLVKLPPWQLARTVMVFLLALGLLSNMTAHYLFRTTWHRWSRVTLPFLFISRRTYLKHFVGGMIRVLPRMIPVLFLMSFVVFFYAFLGFVVYREEPLDKPFLADLELFSEPMSAALTFLRIFMSIPFMLDVEELYKGRKFVREIGLSYGVIMVIFLGALVPAVANRNFQHQSKESYLWVTEQRKLALTRAYMLFKREDGTVGRGDWVSLMGYLRPDCSSEYTSALFDAAKRAETSPDALLKSRGRNTGDKQERLSKGGFFMLCALGRATFSKPQKRIKYHGTCGSMRKRLDSALSWHLPAFSFPLSLLMLYIMIVIQGYQMVRAGDDPQHRPVWADSLGGWLITYFCINASLRMVAQGIVRYLGQWRHALGMTLNIIGIAYYMGLWFPGEAWHSVYQLLQASRLMILWNVFHRINPTSSEVATRLELVFPAVLRSSFVLFSVIYSYAVVGFAMYCPTPLGILPIDDIAQNTMVQRFAFYRHAISFASLHESFAAMTDVVMLSNWPIFMDAAGDVGNVTIARLFFYSFKGLTFYFVMPVMLGFIVQSYMAAKLPGKDGKSPQSNKANSRPPMPRDADTAGGEAGSSMMGAISSSGAGASDGGMGSSLHKDDSLRSYNGSNFGFSTFGDSSEKHISIVPEEVGEEGSSDEDEAAPVIITSQTRSLSQAFWGAEQAKDQEGTKEQAERASTMHDTLEKLDKLEHENFTLRTEMDMIKMELHLAKAKLYDEWEQQSSRESSPVRSSWNSRRGFGANSPQEDLPARKRTGSANSAKGMEAIFEREEEEMNNDMV